MKKIVLFIITSVLFIGTAHGWPKPKPCPKPKPAPVKEELSQKKKESYALFASGLSVIGYGAMRDAGLSKLKSYVLAVGLASLAMKAKEGGDLGSDAAKAALPGALLGPVLFFEF